MSTQCKVAYEIYLRAEHCGAIGTLLILLAIQTYMKLDTVPTYSVDLWIDNAEVLARGKGARKGTNIKDHLVLDYDLLREMAYL